MAFLSSMSKTPPNLELLYDQVLEFDSNQPNDYLESIVSYLSDNSPQIRNVFDNLLGVFANNPSMSNAFRLIFFIIVRIGSPSFFSLECSKIPETNLDPSTQHKELVELKRITKYCVEKFQKMQTIHELPNIGHKYSDLCQIVEDDPQIPDISLTEFEKQYSELSIKFQQIAQTLETIVSENKQNSETLDQGRVVQLLEQIDGLTIQPDQRFTKAENELVLNFFHQRYALINKVHNEFPQILEDYQQKKEQKKTQKPKEKEEDSHNENKQIQELQIQSIKDFMYFVEGTSLAAFPESMTLEYKDYIFPFSNEIVRQKLKNTICAFLNTNGGRIIIGVGNDGFRVKGLFLTSNDQDDLIRDIDDLLKDFHPKVEAEEVITTFIPVKKKDSSYKPGFYVVKILVKRGKPNELYFTGKNCFKRRNGLNEYQTAAYFKKDIIERAAITIVSHPDLFKDKGEFNDALPELGIPVTNVKNQQFLDKQVKGTGKQKLQAKHQIIHQNLPSSPPSNKLLIQNLPPQQDVGSELKAILDSIPPLQKVLHFNRDNEAVLTFIRAEEAKAFLEVVEKAPISLGNNVLTFTVKKSEKEKAQKGEKVEKIEKLDKSEKKDKQEKQGKQDKVEKIEKNQNKYQVGKNKALLVNLKKCIEVEEERKEPQKGKQDTSSVIWVRGIPENTPKEKLTALLENYSQKLKDIKIHNKKKRATFEFDSFILANEVLAFLTSQDRFIDEIKVTFEKATPPSSPTQVSKPFESLKNLEASSKTKEQVKLAQSKTGKPEQTKPLENQPIQASQPTQQSPPTSSSILKISNVPLEETSQEVGYLVRACNHHIRKTVEAKYFKDYVLFYFKTKEDAIKAFEFLIENNFTFKGKKLKVEYQFPMKKSSNEGSIQSKTSKGYEEGFPVIQDAQSLTYFQGNKNYDLGYGGNTFDQQREDQNILEILQSQQHPMFVNNIEQQSPVDPGKFSFNLGQKSNLQQSQDEIDRLIKMTEEQFQYDINFPSETFPDQLETKISMASSIHFTPQNTSMSFQESSPDFPHQQSQGQENVKQAAQVNPRENSVFGFPQGQGQETQKNQPILNTQAQQIRGPIPPTSIPQNFPQYPPQNFNQMEQQGGMKTQFGRSPTNASQQGQQFSYPGSQQEIPLIGTQPGFNSLPSLSNQVQGNFQKMNNQGNVGGQQTLGQTGGHQLANQQIAQSIPSGGTQKIQSSQQTLPQMGNQFNDSKQQIGSNPQQSQGNMSYQNQNQPMMYNPQIPQLNQQYGGIGGQVPYTGVEQSGVNAQVNQSKNPQQTQLPFQQQSFHPNQTPNYPQQQWQGQQSLNQGNSQNYIPPKDQSFGQQQQYQNYYPPQQFPQGQYPNPPYQQGQGFQTPYPGQQSQAYPQGQYPQQTGQFPVQQGGQFPNQQGQYPTQQGQYPYQSPQQVGNVGKSEQVKQSSKTNTKTDKKQPTQVQNQKQQTQGQIPLPIQGQPIGQGQPPYVGNYQNYGMPYYQGQSQNQMQGGMDPYYRQNVGPNQGVPVQNPMYQNLPSELSRGGPQGPLNPVNSQQIPYGGQQFPYVNPQSQQRTANF